MKLIFHPPFREGKTYSAIIQEVSVNEYGRIIIKAELTDYPGEILLQSLKADLQKNSELYRICRAFNIIGKHENVDLEDLIGMNAEVKLKQGKRGDFFISEISPAEEYEDEDDDEGDYEEDEDE